MKTYYKVYHISFLPNWIGDPMIEENDLITEQLDDRTARTRTFDTKEEAVAYIKETQEWQKEWLAKIELKKVVETDEKW
jgi:hypothetical protein